MKKWLFIFMAFGLMTNTYAKDGSNYVGFGYGIASSASDVSILDGIDGSVMMISFGRQISDSFTWEFLGRKTSFDEKTSSVDLTALGGERYDFKYELDALFLGTGLRWTFVKFFNLHAGLGYSTVNLTTTTTGSTSGTSSLESDDSGLGLYYGLGLQLPLGKVHIFADYTINAFSGDVTSKEIVGGLRFWF